jgi:N-methylhydantoinase A/oxoprolinase/acetone carboxylase beta subunit
MRIGIDVGGTNTDAVLLTTEGILAKAKTSTTADVTSGIVTALTSLLEQSGVPATDVTAVMVGTTHFTNAVVQRRDLSPVAAIRLGLPATECLPPTVDWPDDLREASGVRPYLVRGGVEFDGREIAPLDHDELDRIADDLLAHGIHAAALTSVFSPIDARMEHEAAAHLAARVPGLDVTFSHEIGRVGLLERENAAILNASLRDLARRTITGFHDAIRRLDLGASVFLTQNDGTLMTAEHVERYPVLTFSSGPTNSMRGAGYLSGLTDALVADIGGTTTDVGALAHGFPREASLAVDVGGVRTNFRMPDVLSVALGGGTVVRLEEGGVRIGPDSVGYRLQEQARIFGGDVLTATDVIAAAGKTDLGDRGRVGDLPAEVVADVERRMQEIVDDAVDRVRLSNEPLPVIVVGGGRLLVTRPVSGASTMIVPEHYEVANAVGAAIAQVSGEVDRVVSLAGTSRDAAIAAARAEAEAKAVAAGADPSTIQLLDAEDVPLAYLPGNASRVRVKVVGDLAEGHRI